MRTRPSASLVVASLALAFSLAGTAEAALVITKNSQVGAHTIAGANAPKGDHKNLIAGSVGRSDLHANAVNGKKVAAKSLNGTDLANGTIGTIKLRLPKIDFAHANTDPNDAAPHHTLLSLDGLSIRASCFDSGGGVGLTVFATSPSAGSTLRGDTIIGPTNHIASSVNLLSHQLSTTPVQLGSLVTSSGGLQEEWHLVYRNAPHVVSLDIDGFADATSNVCAVHGTAVPAPH
jgi:hypothetical protein